MDAPWVRNEQAKKEINIVEEMREKRREAELISKLE